MWREAAAAAAAAATGAAAEVELEAPNFQNFSNRVSVHVLNNTDAPHSPRRLISNITKLRL
jgi:hypothetical protein